MDPISQGVVGAAVAHAAVGHKLPRLAVVAGALAGMAPDLDVLVPTFGDPTAGWYWHRGPTHALAALPVGAAVVTAVLMLLPAARRRKGAVFVAALLGWLTHGPLDALTSYGTMLFWPFSEQRVALDWMPIIDVVFTPVLLVLVGLGLLLGRARWSQVACGFLGAYVAFGAWQHGRALAAAEALAASRGEPATRVRAMPAPGALSLWRTTYERGGELRADAVFVPYLGGTARVLEGTSAELVRPPSPGARPFEGASSWQEEQFARFRWFTGDAVVRHDPAAPLRLGDGRYSARPAGFSPLWGVDFSDGTARRFSGRGDFDAGALVDMLLGRDGRFVPVEGGPGARGG